MKRSSGDLRFFVGGIVRDEIVYVESSVYDQEGSVFKRLARIVTPSSSCMWSAVLLRPEGNSITLKQSCRESNRDTAAARGWIVSATRTNVVPPSLSQRSPMDCG